MQVKRRTSHIRQFAQVLNVDVVPSALFQQRDHRSPQCIARALDSPI
jgi:hypothetical protein